MILTKPAFVIQLFHSVKSRVKVPEDIVLDFRGEAWPDRGAEKFSGLLPNIEEINMKRNEIIKQIIILHKSFFENYFMMMVMFQDQTEEVWKKLLNMAPEGNEDNEEIMNDWIHAYKHCRDEFKKTIDKGYEKAETFFDYNAMLAFQEQTEKMFESFLSEAGRMPADFKKAAEDAVSAYKNSCQEFRRYVDEKINRLESFIPEPGKLKPRTRRKQSS